MAEEMKTRSIRADEQTLERFKALSEEFDNQGECLSSLIKAYEISKAKSVLTDTSRSIEDFEMHTTAIQDIFITLLESINNADERIKNKYEIELQTRTRTIADLQEQNTALNNQLDSTQSLLDLKQGIVSQLTEDNNKAESTINSLNSQLEDKQNIIAMQNKELEKLNKVEELERQNKALADENKKLLEDKELAERTIINLKTDLEKEKSNAELERQKAELNKQLEVSKVKETYSDKLETVRAEKDKLRDEINKLKDRIRQLETGEQEDIQIDLLTDIPTDIPEQEEDNPDQLTFED